MIISDSVEKISQQNKLRNIYGIDMPYSTSSATRSYALIWWIKNAHGV